MAQTINLAQAADLSIDNVGVQPGNILVPVSTYYALYPLEAALRGIPSIVTDLPVFAATLGDAAIRVPVDDELRLAAALMECGADKALRERLSADSHDAVKRFTAEDSAHRMHAILAASAQAG